MKLYSFKDSVTSDCCDVSSAQKGKYITTKTKQPTMAKGIGSDIDPDFYSVHNSQNLCAPPPEEARRNERNAKTEEKMTRLHLHTAAADHSWISCQYETSVELSD